MNNLTYTFLLAAVLFVISVVEDRRMAFKSAALIFGVATLMLTVFINGVIIRVVLGDPLEVVAYMPLSEVWEWTIYSFGGYANFFGAGYLSGAAAMGLMYLLSSIMQSVDREIYAIGFFICLFSGVVLLIGFIVFFDVVGVILGIVSSVIGIILGLKKLAARNSQRDRGSALHI